jgi:hypothetical protein
LARRQFRLIYQREFKNSPRLAQGLTYEKKERCRPQTLRSLRAPPRSFVVSNNTHNTNLTERNFSRFLMSSLIVFVGFGLASLASDCMRALWCLATNWCARFVLFCWLVKCSPRYKYLQLIGLGAAAGHFKFYYL